MEFLEKLKQRWGITSNVQIAIIMVVFAITGFSIVLAKPYVFSFLGIDSSVSLWIRVLAWLFTILPLYYLFLLFFGTLFGQRVFFYSFAKKSFSRFRRKKRTD